MQQPTDEASPLGQKDVKPDQLLILAYHSISRRRTDSLAVRTADFEWQVEWLHNHGYRSLTLAEYMAHKPSSKERVVILTFDDGYADNYHEAFPVLQRYGYTATIFLVSDYLNTKNTFPWDASKITASVDRSHFEVLTWKQIHEMAASGIEFGSHTCTHPELGGVSRQRCWEEVDRSRRDLAQALGQDIVSFSYPRGSVNEDVIQMVQDAGYGCGVVTPPRSGIPLSRLTLRRIGVYYRNTPWSFRLKTTPIVRRHYEHWKWLQGRRQ